MKKYITGLIVLIMCTSANLQAQKKQYYNIGWGIGVPIGDFADYISSTSLRGGYFSGNVFVTDAVSVGFKFGYNSYHENAPRQTHQMGNGTAITAATYNYSVQAPLQVGGYYHFNTSGQFEPYIGLGLGINYITEETLIQDFDFYDDQWAFLLNPEIGIRYQFKNSPVGITARAGYTCNFNSFTLWGIEYKNVQTLNFELLLGCAIR